MARLAIRMPKMSMTMTEGDVSEWHVSVGDEVAVGDVVCEVMTDKVDMEVESTVAGTLVEIVVDAGVAEVGAPIAWVDGEDDFGGFGDLLAEPAPDTALPEDAPAEPSVDLPSATVAPEAAPEPEPEPTAAGPTPAVPRARGLARQHGIDLASIRGTGPDGLVTVGDVEARLAPTVTPTAAPAAPTAPTPTAPAATATVAAPPAHVAPTPASANRRAAVRQIVARTMEPSALIPQFTVWRDVDLSAANAQRNGLSWNTLLLRSYAAALREVPELLSRWEDGRPVDSGPPTVAVAVATDRGLLVPVVSEPDALSAPDLDAELKQVFADAQRGKVSPDHLAVANGSLSSLGSLGVDRFQALITPPQASVLSVGSIKQRPVAVPGGVGLALTVTLGLTIDHRVADGSHAALLMEAIVRHLDDAPR
jgi:pyruvate dehydrogenase E2 component (dihydrolipoamide acetyltransferase)